jgi:hypothetical protein
MSEKMIMTGVRLPADLAERAQARVRKIEPDVTLTGVIRYAVALFAGLSIDQAADQLKIRKHGYTRTSRADDA